MKRKADDAALRVPDSAVKKAKPSVSEQPASTLDYLSRLSDELLLRIFSTLPVLQLTVCQLVSKKFSAIAGDSQLWRKAYYERFVGPRYDQLPRSRKSAQARHSRTTTAPTKLAKWLDESSLVTRGTATNWKRQYRLRHKWANGSCNVDEMEVASRPPPPPMLAKLRDGIVFTVDATSGLRSWSYKQAQELLGSCVLQSPGRLAQKPTSLAIDSSLPTDTERLTIGFDDGAFVIYTYDRSECRFSQIYTHPPSSNGSIDAVALDSQHLLTMNESHTLSLYKLEQKGSVMTARLLTSLRSHTIWAPLSLSLRSHEERVTAAIAYSLPTFNSGWTVGVQELQLSPQGDVQESRLASSMSQGFSVLQASQSATPAFAKPTSLSYAHPYLLVSHADNTLTLYMVTSTADRVIVGPGKQLWGHTSSVFAAQICARGKAVSVSTRGNEVRVWELEGASKGERHGKGRSIGTDSVQVTPQKHRKHDVLSHSPVPPLPGHIPAPALDVDVTRAYAGFDESSVVVVREQGSASLGGAPGRQALTVYDFS